jgi:hypothetical protein
METPPNKTISRSIDRVEALLLTIDASIRNGKFVDALRTTNKLAAELNRGELSAGENTSDLICSLKRTRMFLMPIIDAYAQNQHSIGLLKEKICKTKQN